MKSGDLVKVKDACAYGGVYMQQIAGCEALILSYREQSPLSCFVLVCSKIYLVWSRDLEVLHETG